MLLEYCVSNFCSIKDEQTFSMLSVPTYKEKSDSNLINLNNDLNLLKSTAIYGANASGKSTFLESLNSLKSMVLNSFQFGINDELHVEPFAFDDSFNKPTTFDITFIENNIKYDFGLVVTKERVIEEYLIAYPKGQPQTWYNRIYDTEKEEYFYQYGSAFKGQKKTWEKSTKKNVLYLSTAVNLAKDEDAQLLPVYFWFDERLKAVSISGWTERLSKSYCQDDEKKQKIINFLNLSGIDIKDIIVDIQTRSRLFPEAPSNLDNSVVSSLNEMESILNKLVSSDELEKLKKNIKIKFVHSNGISLDLEKQSDGTRKLFAFASHWLNSLENNCVIFIDELNDNFHPSLVRLLVDMFNDAKLNDKAQLIFTTHETSILSQDVFRRDQVWFCERNENLETKIYPLSKFKPRKDYENLENAYLSGKYGATPYFNKIKYKMNKEN